MRQQVQVPAAGFLGRLQGLCMAQGVEVGANCDCEVTETAALHVPGRTIRQ